MKATREELIDFFQFVRHEYDGVMYTITPEEAIDNYLKSINSEVGNETPTVTDNEAEKEFCQICGRFKILKSEHLCADCFDKLP